MTNLLVFEIADRRLAVLAGDVREVTRAAAIAELPGAPPVVEGVINVRGSLVPVLSVRARLGLVPVPLAPEQHFVIVRAGPRVVALRVDQATDMVPVEEDAIRTAGEVVPGIEGVAGIAALPDGLLVIHDLSGFLALDEARQVDAAVAAAVAPPAGS